MKKTILISIIASATLFGATVNDLTTDQVNKVLNNAQITGANINQGQVAVSGSTTSVVSYQHGGTADGANTNTIDGTSINGDSASEATIQIDQGGLAVSNGADVSNSEDHSSSTIKDGTITSSSTGSVTVKQADIEINGGTYSNMDIHSTNNITDAVISASGEGNATLVTQATLKVSDANVSDSADATNVDLTSTNTIKGGGEISNSTVKQSDTSITGSNTIVSGLDVTQSNTIDTTGSINNSTVTQATTSVSDSTLTNFTEDINNTMTDISADNAVLKQNDIVIKNGSNVNELTNTTDGDHRNTMNAITATDGANLTQDTITIDGATIDTMSSTQENYMDAVTAHGTYNVKQSDISISNANVNNQFDVKYHNEMISVDMIGSGNVSQGTLTIGESNATGTTEANAIDIQATNTLKNTDLDNSDVTQSSTSILAQSSISGFSLDQTNTIENTDGSADNNMTGATISQAETLISASTVDEFTQTVTNNIKDVTVDSSYVYQAKVNIANSDVDSLTMSETNTLNSSSLSGGATLAQGGVDIQ